MPSTEALNRFYTIFLYTYIPTILCFDGINVYPPSIVPTAMKNLHDWYVTSYNDQLAITMPPWFIFFFYIEVFYQLPAAIYLVYLLRNRKPAADLHMLVWGIITCLTTLTCLWEFAYNTAMTDSEKLTLIGMYGGYAVVFAMMVVDCWMRIGARLGMETGKKVQ